MCNGDRIISTRCSTTYGLYPIVYILIITISYIQYHLQSHVYRPCVYRAKYQH
jgi:hypothetical protein